MSRDEIDSLSPAKRALFERLLRQRREGATGPGATAAIPRRPAGSGALPMSFAQERLWFLDRLQRGNPAYHIPIPVQLSGELRADLLARSLRSIVERHEALRTRFEEQEGRPVQVIQPEPRLPFLEVDLTALPAASRAEQTRRSLLAEARRAFDLRLDPLIRVLLLRQGAGEHVLLLTLHHIVFDAWSTGLLIRELTALYLGYASGRPAVLAPLPVQYGDFALWQRRWLAGGELEVQLAYWRARLPAEGDALLTLPCDRSRPPVQTSAGAAVCSTLPAALARQARELARHQRTTLFVVLLAALQALLYRYTGQRGIPIGTPIANRNRTEVEPLIGFFVNTLVLRTEVDGELGFAALVERASAVAVGAFAHQDLPFAKLVEMLRPRRDLSRSPFFQIQLSFRNAAVAAVEIAGLRLAPIEPDYGFAQFDLTVSISVQGDELPIDLSYNTDLFDASTVERLLGHLEVLLAAALAQPQQRLDELPLLRAAEAHHLLCEWNDTATRYPPEHTLHRQIAAQARRAPAAVALRCGGQELRYGELDRRANQLARLLLSLGIRRGDRVGIALERSFELVIGLLAILKAGAAYVPLDPGYPAERLGRMIEDARLPALLTTRALAGGLPPALPARRVLLDAESERIAAQTDGEPPASAGADDLAYVIFTSGSTGRPKGAMNSHRAISNRLYWMQERFALAATDRVLHKTPIGFDVSVWELFWPLLCGASMVLAEPGAHADVAYLRDLVIAEGVTVAHFVPALLVPFVDQPDVEDCRTLRLVVASGEALSAELVRRFAARLGAALHNLYGPTEAAVDVTDWRCADPGGRATAPIGRPIANLRVHVLDAGLRLAPIGVAGELFIGGAGVGRGYLGRPDLTAERFIPDPFSPAPGERLYRTGDLVVVRPGGEIEFLGRIDHQVKIRGVRIELGEIEAALERLPLVAAAVVLTAADAGGELGLVAYLQPAGPAAPTPQELRTALRRELPEAMVPAAYDFVEAMPLSPNGKVDRRALSARRPQTAPAARVAARNELERLVAALWCEVLGVSEVGVEDNFFDLGGHSLKLIEVQSRLRERLGARLTVVELFQLPTVAALAGFLVGRSHAPAAPAATPAAAPALRLGPAHEPGRSEVAIIGIAGRFPGAQSIEQFWRNLREGVESISFFRREEMLAEGVAESLLARPDWVPAGGVLEGADQFDHRFFGFNPREAETLDPQHRLFLECAWEALESAACDPMRHPGAIGVWAGTGMNTYAFQNLLGDGDAGGGPSFFQVMIDNDKDFLATRTSYCLNLRGPSITVQTACSTSLVAVALACQALAAGHCDLALAGGVSMRTRQRTGYGWQEGSILSKDGHCRAFDARAGGTVGGSGVGVVVLKRLAEAVAAGDPIAAVIKGSAVNNDGAQKVGYTAPSVRGQAEVIARALAAAGVEPRTIRYVEAHGTGTALGDPIEIAALQQAFQGAGLPPRWCAVGSVKTNVGHLDTAAGVCGLIKTVLALRHHEIPPSLHFERPSPKIDFAGGPFYVNAELSAWPADGSPRRAAVSSFGIGGTNAHVVLEEAPEPPPSSPAAASLLLLSARTPQALEAATDRLAAHLEAHPELTLADVAFTLQQGRRAFELRRVAVAVDAAAAAGALRGRDPRRVHTGSGKPRARSVVFLFPGQGAQQTGMAAELLAGEPRFRAHLESCASLLAPHLRDPAGVAAPELARLLAAPAAPAAAALDETWLAQPALFAVEYALAHTWMAWGVRPEAMLGHSLGEYVAACLAGVLTLADALALVAARGRLMQGLPAGAMLSVGLAEREAAARLGAGLCIAAVNGPRLTTIAGEPAAVERLAASLAAEGVSCRRLRTRRAFHSPMVEAIEAPLRELLAGLRLSPPELPYLSSLSGTWITAEQATDPGYWYAQLRQPVRFAAALEALRADADTVFLEVGPGRTLSSLVRDAPTLASLPGRRDGRGELETLLLTLGRLWALGVDVDWAALHLGVARRRLALPTYPFERQRCWAVPRRRGATAVEAAAPPAWLHAPLWSQAPAARRRPPPEGSRWLLVSAGGPLEEALAAGLEAAGASVVRVAPESGGPTPPGWRCVPPHDGAAWAALVAELAEPPGSLAGALCFWPAAAGAGEAALVEQWRPLAALRPLAAALAAAGRGSGAEAGGVGGEGSGVGPALVVVTWGGAEVVGDEPAAGAAAAAPALLERAAGEVGLAGWSSLDLPPAAPAVENGWQHLGAALLAELAHRPGGEVLAWRGRRRWRRRLEPVARAVAPGEPAPAPLLRPAGVYVILGEGEPARQIASALAATAAHPVLAAPAAPPLPVSAGGAAAAPSGADMPEPADLASAAGLGDLLQSVRRRWGTIAGLIDARPLDAAGDAPAAPTGRPGELAALQTALAGEDGLELVLLLDAPGAAVAGTPAAAVDLRWIAAEQAARLARACDGRGGPMWLAVACRPAGRGAAAGLAPGEAAWIVLHLPAAAPGGELVVTLADLPPRRGAASPPAEALTAPAPVEAREAGEADIGRLPAGGPGASAAGDPVARAITTIWQDLLGIAGIGSEDDFFELGGHSLLATQVVSRIRDVLRVELPLQAFFDTPTVAGLCAAVAAAGREASLSTAPPLVPVPRDRDLPLSFAQQRLWLIHQLAPASDAYNVPLGVRLRGTLRIAALARTFEEIVRRHESLRTRFAERDGEPVQVIGSPDPVALPLVDLSGLPGRQREPLARRLAGAAARVPCDQAHGPLLRIWLLRLSAGEHLALLNLHHIVTDGWSMGVLVQEICVIYTALVTGRPVELPPLPLQYADFAVWQRRWLAGEILARQLAFWRATLGTDPPPLALPVDRPRAADRIWGGASRRFELRQGLRQALQSFAQERGATLFMALLAGWSALLHRYSGAPAILIGSPVANRTRLALEPLIGFFVNTLVLRADLAGDPAVAELLARLRAASVAAQAHQDAPFERLVEELQTVRDLSRSPLFQTLFVLQNAPDPPAHLPDLELSLLDHEVRSAQFDLTFQVREISDGLLVTLIYSTDLFDPTTAQRIERHLVTLLGGLASDPTRRVSELPLLDAAERHQVTLGWSAELPAEEPALLHRRFAAQAAAAPSAPALVSEGRTLTYGELDRGANRLAHHLRRLGVGPETVVGVAVERPAPAATALLAILKAGGACWPLDPATAGVKLKRMAAAAGLRVCVADRPLAGLLPAPGEPGAPQPPSLVRLDTIAAELVRCDESPPPDEADAGSLAWLASARGPAGAAEAVLMPHRALADWVGEGSARADSPPRGRALWRLAALDAGGAGEILRALIHDRPPAFPPAAALPATRAAAAVDAPAVSVHRAPAGDGAYVLDVLGSGLQPVPIGVAGELCLGGPGLIRGYLGRPDLTAARLVPDPFATAGPGGRLHRTGALARRRADGTQEVHSRSTPPAPRRAPGAVSTRSPRSATELQLAAIFAAVLRLERVGIDDSFFDLGGHSLKANQVIARLWQACGVKLPLRRLFEAPTVAGLAVLVDQARATRSRESAAIDTLLDHLDELSDDEVETMLAARRGSPPQKAPA
jgi:amino acid adenylation domain-containing protein